MHKVQNTCLSQINILLNPSVRRFFWTDSVSTILLCKQCNSQEFKDEYIKPTAKYDDVVIAKVCKVKEKRKGSSTTKENLIEIPRKTEGELIKILCASQGCYVYRQILRSKVNQYISEHVPGKVFT